MEIINDQLIAPCGMNYAICSSYLAYKNNLPKVKGKIAHCKGCRIRNKQCAFLKKQCKDNHKLLRGEINFCFEYNCFPCDFKARYKNKRGFISDTLNQK